MKLTLLDTSAAFDTIDHGILIDRITGDFGITGIALRCLQSFLSSRSQYVGVSNAWSVSVSCLTGIPQGSVLGPLLFATYISPVANIVKGHNLHQHQYANNNQLYMAIIQSDGGSLHAISSCVYDVCRWFLKNGLLLLFNPAKTEAILFGTRVQRQKISTSGGVDIAGSVVPFCDHVKLLGVTLDATLTMDRHVTDVIRSLEYHTRALRHI